MHGQEEKPVRLTCYFYGTWMYIHIYVPTNLALNISNNVNTKFKMENHNS